MSDLPDLELMYKNGLVFIASSYELMTPSLNRATCQKLHMRSHGISEQCFLLEIIPEYKDITDTAIICGFFYICIFLVRAAKEVAPWVWDLGTSTTVCFYLEVSKKASHGGEYFFLSGRGN